MANRGDPTCILIILIAIFSSALLTVIFHPKGLFADVKEYLKSRFGLG